MTSTNQQIFLQKLQRLIEETEALPQFKGKTQATRHLRKITQLSALRN